jgi:hypothetical protein
MGARVVANPVSNHLAKVLTNANHNRALGFRPKQREYPRIFENPGKWSTRKVSKKAPLIASMVIGLTPGHGKRRKPFTPTELRKAVMKRFPSGGTIVFQLGWYEGSREDSVRITIENSPYAKVSDEKFRTKIKKMASDFTDQFLQNEIWIDFYRGAKRLRGFKSVWYEE